MNRVELRIELESRLRQHEHEAEAYAGARRRRVADFHRGAAAGLKQALKLLDKLVEPPSIMALATKENLEIFRAHLTLDARVQA